MSSRYAIPAAASRANFTSCFVFRSSFFFRKKDKKSPPLRKRKKKKHQKIYEKKKYADMLIILCDRRYLEFVKIKIDKIKEML